MNQSPHDWQELTRLTGGQALIVERVRIAATGVAPNGVAIEGAFALPRLAELSHEDQVFVAAFVGAHGSIKEMEQVFGVSYPTIKARLNRLAAALDPIEREEREQAQPGAAALDRLAAGEIDADEAVRLLKGGS